MHTKVFTNIETKLCPHISPLWEFLVRS